MKKLIIAAIAFIGFNGVSFAQAIPAKKTDASKMQVVKNTTIKKTDAKVVSIAKPSQVVVTKTTSVVTKPVAVTKTVVVNKPNAVAPLKKDGTPDKRYKTTTVTTTGPVRKDGAPDMRYKANKKN